jgi:hypothetical protein
VLSAATKDVAEGQSDCDPILVSNTSPGCIRYQNQEWSGLRSHGVTDSGVAYTSETGEPISSYDGVNGIQVRDDLAGLNLSTVPKVLIECGKMRNATDAS